MRILAFAAFLCLACALPQIRHIKNAGNINRIPGEYLVVLHGSNVNEDVGNYLSNVEAKMQAISNEVTVIKRFDALKSPILFVRVKDENVANVLFQIPDVEAIDANVKEDMIVQCQEQLTGDTLWGLSRISAVATPPPNYPGFEYSYDGNDGTGVNVYVLDTGIRTTHNDFGGRAVFGVNTIGGNDPDVHGHGTHCAGTVAGTVHGVSKGTTVVAVKVLSDAGPGTTEAVIAGINWSVQDIQNKGLRGVLSMSLTSSSNEATDSAVRSAVAAGAPVIAAAGNNNGDACSLSPAGEPAAITVGATDRPDSLSSFSNWGTCVDILAPGSSILSLGVSSDTATRTLSGTSMATPHVAGEAANYLSQNPNASAEDVKAYLVESASKDYIDLRGQTSTPNVLLYASC